MKKTIIILVVLVAALLLVLAIPRVPESVPPVNEESPVPNQVSDLIVVTNPTPNQAVGSPLVIEGRARGSWYFEASFPVTLLDGTGKEIARGHAEAQGNWMTENFVPFIARLEFMVPVSGTGVLVLKKDNPSGLPEYDKELRIPVRWSKGVTIKAACVASGCSGQICSDKSVVSTCEYRPEYACYKTAVCERQPNGECGWTETASLRACLRENKGGADVQ